MDQEIKNREGKTLQSKSIHPDKSDRIGRFSVNLIIMLTVATLTGMICFMLGTRMQTLSATQLDYSELNDVYNTLSAKYDGQLDKKKLIEGAAKGMVQAAGDPYTSYMDSEEYSELEDGLSGSITGIGVELGANKDSNVFVVSTIDGGPAKKAGIRAGDIIYGVDGKLVTGLNISEVAKKIRGKIDTEVKLIISRSGERKKFNIIRARISTPSVKSYIKDNVGYLRISTFGDDTVELAQKAANDFKNNSVKSVILDLRGNTGGYVDAARGVTGIWLPKGSVVTQERSGDKVIDIVKTTSDPILRGTKTIILINGATASASEITAGALHDSAGAILVGAKSFGKGVVQEVAELANGDKLKVTIAKWYTPKGKNIHGEGLRPDKIINMTADQYEAGNDVQLDYAFKLAR